MRSAARFTTRSNDSALQVPCNVVALKYVSNAAEAAAVGRAAAMQATDYAKSQKISQAER